MIRKITRRDKEIFLALSEEFYASSAVLHPLPRAFHERTFAELMRSDKYAEGFILEEDDTAVGFGLTAKTFSREGGGMVLWLEELYILPDYRCRGLGKQYFDFIEEYARKNNFARIRLEVEEYNVRARALYERLGYQPLEYCQMVKELALGEGK